MDTLIYIKLTFWNKYDIICSILNKGGLIMPILTAGIILPNGRFLPNGGDGHSKNAIRFCWQYPRLDELRLSANEFNPDEFMISAGCAIIAGYRGKQCFKIAQDNKKANMNTLKKEYEEQGFEIWPYWNINPEYENALEDIIRNMTKNQIIVREKITMDLRGKVGFIIGGRFYPNNGRGHESNARDIIRSLGWDKQWRSGEAQDFLVCEKGAIQIGSGADWNKIVVGRQFFNESKVERIEKMYNLHGYRHDIIRY